MSNSFFVYVPSNIQDYPDNRPNKFRMHLPRPIELEGNWVCGLHSISFPYSWASTILDDNQAIYVHYNETEKKERLIKIPIPKASHKSIDELQTFLHETIKFQAKALNKAKNAFLKRPTIENGVKVARGKRAASTKADREKIKQESPPRKAPAPPKGSPPSRVGLLETYFGEEQKEEDKKEGQNNTGKGNENKPVTARSSAQVSTPNIETNTNAATLTSTSSSNQISGQNAQTTPIQATSKPSPPEAKPKATAVDPVSDVSPLLTTFFEDENGEKGEQSSSNATVNNVNDENNTKKEENGKKEEKGGGENGEENEGEEEKENWGENLISTFFDDLPMPEVKSIDLLMAQHMIDSIGFQYHKEFQRFRAVFTDPNINYILFTPQLAYVLGWENGVHVKNGEIAKYGCDLKGGFSSFGVYTKGLTENMIIGNKLSSLLRVVSISGSTPGEYTEQIYDSPIYVKVLPKTVNEIEIELLTMEEGRLLPLDWGQVMIVLIFKRIIQF